MNRTERILTILLRLLGVMMLFALLAIPLPRAWMAAIHAWLGLGPFPAGPLVDYLARSISGLYAIHGGLLLVCSTDLRRYRPVLQYCLIAGLLFGAAMTAIDFHAGMPIYWSACEGPFVMVFGVVGLGMLRNVETGLVP